MYKIYKTNEKRRRKTCLFKTKSWLQPQLWVEPGCEKGGSRSDSFLWAAGGEGYTEDNQIYWFIEILIYWGYTEDIQIYWYTDILIYWYSEYIKIYWYTEDILIYWGYTDIQSISVYTNAIFLYRIYMERKKYEQFRWAGPRRCAFSCGKKSLFAKVDRPGHRYSLIKRMIWK